MVSRGLRVLGRAGVGALLSALVLFGLPLVAAPPAAASTGSGVVLGGHVTDSASKPISGMYVQVTRTDGTYVDTVTTDSTGAWQEPPSGSTNLLAAGSFIIHVYGGNYSDVWYPNATTSAGAVAVTLADGTSDTTLNVAMPAGHSISGTVSITGGASAAGVTVMAQSNGGLYFSPSTTVDSAGHYTISGLIDGSWTLTFSGSPSVNVVTAQYANGTPVTVSGTNVSGINETLVPGGTISGRVTLADAPGTAPQCPLYLSCPQVYDATTGNPVYGLSITDNADGTYSVTGLPAGTYQVLFTAAGHTPQWWNGATTQSAATAIPLAEGALASGIDATLAVGLSVSGKITDSRGNPIVGASVEVSSAAPGDAQYTYSQSDGTFSAAGLSTGTYSLYVGAPSDVYLSASQTFSVASANVTGIAVTLPDAAVVTGHVLRLDSSAVSDAVVTLEHYDATFTGWFPEQTVTAAFDGSFRLGGIQPGSGYRLSAHDVAGIAADTTTSSFATTAGSQVQDVVMAPGGTIAGTITGTGGAALAGASVQAVNVTTYDSFVTVTDSSGHYSVGGLPAGTYTVTFSDQPTYLDATASAVSVAASTTTTLDQVLTLGSTISGTVVDGHGQPVAGVRVGVGTVGQDLTCVSAHDVVTDATGAFSIPGLTAGNYNVVFGFPGCAYSSGNIVGEYWQDVAPGGTPTTVTLGSGQTVSLAAHVTRYSVLSGTATLGGTSLVNATVSAWAVGASYAFATASTDGSGAFSLAVPAGDYKLQVTPASNGFLPSFWYGQTPDRVLATVVTVATETDQSGITITAPYSGALAGTLTSGGSPVTTGAEVDVADSRGDVVASSPVDASGAYRVAGLPSGQYRLHVHAYGSADFWVGGTDFASAAVQQVADGATTTVDIAAPTVAVPGTISTTLTAGGSAATGYVQIVDAVTGDYVTSCYTDPSSGSTCSGTAVPPGSYKVFASSGTPGYADTWYGGADFAHAAVVSVSSGTDASVTIALQQGGSVAISVTNATQAQLTASITVTPTGGGSAVSSFYDTIASGAVDNETTSGLAPGTYRVTSWHGAEITTTTVTVTAGTTVPASLTLVSTATTDVTATVSGVVRDTTGTAVAGASVCLPYVGLCGTTVTDGSYAITGVPAGDWGLAVSTTNGLTLVGQAPSLVVDPLKSTTLSAPPITVGAPASVSGSVTLPNGGGPASDAHVTLLQGQAVVGEAYTDLAGAWSLTGLSPGDYTVEVDTGSDLFEKVWYPASLTQAGASAVTVAVGSSVTGVDVTLVAAKSPSRLSLTASSAAGVGSSVTLTATVVSADTGGTTPTGSVQFSLDGTAVGSPAALVNGIATTQVTTTQAQSMATAEYGGDATYGRSQDQTQVLATADATTTTLVSPPTMAVAGAAVTYDVTVADSGSGTTPTGWVTLSADDGTQLMSTQLVGGAAAITTHELFAGTHSVWVDYQGDTTHQGSTSAPATIDVAASGPTLGSISGTVTSGPSAPVQGVTVDLYSAASGNPFVREATTAADGTYSFGGLAAGSYLVRFTGSTIATQWWQTGTSAATATAVSVTDGTATTVSPVVTAVAPPGGSVAGTVTAASGGAVVTNAWVQLCGTSGTTWCGTTTTDTTGAYSFTGLADATYQLVVLPWGVGLDQGDAAVTVSGGAAVTQNVALAALVAPSSSVTVTTSDGVTQDGVPIATWSDPIPVSYAACAGGSGSYKVTDSTGATVSTGTLTEGPSGTYTATVPALSPVSGMLSVAVSVTCPDTSTASSSFNLYIDPSGQVVDTQGNPVAGATVTLAQFDPTTSTYVPVPNGSTVMSPANRTNPDTTDTHGHFGWDVQAGHYQVSVSKTGCTKPGDPSTTVVTSGDLEIPPAVTDISLTLDCSAAAGPTVTSAPTGVSASAGDGSAAVSWSAPSSLGGSLVTSYTVTASPGGATCTATAPATSCTVSGLTDGTAYTFTVTATNATGTSPASAPSLAVIPMAPLTAPSAPSGVSATAGDGSAAVSWSAPSSDGGSAIASYMVTASPGGATCTATAPATSCTVSGLTNGTAYTFTVTATNGVGTSPASAPSLAVIPMAPLTAPSAPSGVSATAGDGSAAVSWSAPSSDGGSAIASYMVTASPGGATCTATAPATSCTVSGLTDGTAYTFTVTATNGVGTSPASASSAPVTPTAPTPPPPVATAPSAPSGVTATVANASSVVSWSAPSSDGGSAIASYTVTASPGGATCTATAPATSCTVSGLTNGTAYTFTVTATNGVGTSPASAPSPAVTPDGVAPVVSVRALPVATLATSVRTSWSAVDSGSGVASYDVRYERASYASGFGSWVYPSAWQRTTTTAVTLPVAAGFDYCVSVRARDHVGNVSSWSAVRCVARALDDRALVASRGWVRRTGRAFYLHTVTTTTSAGVVLSRTGARLDRVGVVVTTCPTCGVVGVYVGRALVGRINLHSAKTRYQQILLLPRFSYRSGTVLIRSLTARKLVAVDGLVITRT